MLYLILRYFKTFHNIRKKLLRQFATSASSETKFLLSIKVIFSFDLVFSERKGLIVCQNFLLSVISFSFKLAKAFYPLLAYFADIACYVQKEPPEVFCKKQLWHRCFLVNSAKFL